MSKVKLTKFEINKAIEEGLSDPEMVRAVDEVMKELHSVKKRGEVLRGRIDKFARKLKITIIFFILCYCAWFGLLLYAIVQRNFWYFFGSIIFVAIPYFILRR